MSLLAMLFTVCFFQYSAPSLQFSSLHTSPWNSPLQIKEEQISLNLDIAKLHIIWKELLQISKIRNCGQNQMYLFFSPLHIYLNMNNI